MTIPTKQVYSEEIRVENDAGSFIKRLSDMRDNILKLGGRELKMEYSQDNEYTTGNVQISYIIDLTPKEMAENAQRERRRIENEIKMLKSTAELHGYTLVKNT